MVAALVQASQGHHCVSPGILPGGVPHVGVHRRLPEAAALRRKGRRYRSLAPDSSALQSSMALTKLYRWL